MLDDALSYPRRDEDWLKTTLIGGLVTLLGFIPILPELVLGGYYSRVLAAPGDDQPPRFGDWEDLLMDGLTVFVVWLVYTLVPGFLLGAMGAVLALGLGVSAATLPVEGGSEAAATLSVVVLVGLLLFVAVALVVTVVAMYVAPAAAALAAREDSISAGFAFGRLGSVLRSRAYAGAWLRALLVVVVGSFVGAILLLVFFLGLFVMFYASVVATRLLAVGVDRALPAAEPGAAPDA